MKRDRLIPVEKSKKVIYLDPRGRGVDQKHYGAMALYVLAVLCALYCVGIGLFVSFGSYFFLIWGAIAAFCAARRTSSGYARWWAGASSRWILSGNCALYSLKNFQPAPAAAARSTNRTPQRMIFRRFFRGMFFHLDFTLSLGALCAGVSGAGSWAGAARSRSLTSAIGRFSSFPSILITV